MEYILIAILAAYIYIVSRRVTELEEKVKGKESDIRTVATAPLYQPSLSPIPPAVSPSVPVPPPVPMPQAVPLPPDAPPADAFAWLKKDFFVKLGALLLLIAFGWFVSYAFANNWIGPWGRVLFGVAAGLGVFAFGAYRLKVNQQQGSIFIVLGSAITIMSVWAARELYGFFTPTIALGLMVIPVVVANWLSVRDRIPGLAIASFVLGTLAPFFTASPEPSLLGFSTYLLLLILGTLWVGFRIDTLVLTPIALGVVIFWSAYFTEGVSGEQLTQGLIFAFAFTACFFVSNVVSLLNHHADTMKASHLITGLGTGLYLYFWIAGATSGAFESFLYAAWMVISILAGFFVFQRTGKKEPFYLYGAVGLAFAVALTANLFSGVVLTMVYAAQLALVIVATRFVSVDSSARQALAWLYLPLCLVATEHMTSPQWETAIWHRDFAALLVVTASLLVAGISLRRGKEEQRHLFASVTLLGTAAGFVLIQFLLVLNVLFELTLAATIFSLVVAVGSTVAYSISVRLQIRVLKLWAMTLSITYPYLILLSFEYITGLDWYGGLFHLDSLMLLSITLGFWLATIVTFQKAVRAASEKPVQILGSLAGLYSLIYLWLVFHAVFADGIATTISLITYAVIGLVLFVYGRIKELSFIRLWGAGILCGVVARLLLVEIWELSITMRIVTFFIVGVLLISTAFIGRKESVHKE